MRRRSLLALVVIGAVMPAAPALGGPAVDTVRVRNGAVEFGFDGRTGALLDMIDRASGRDFVDGANGVWQIDRYDSAQSITPAQARTFASRALPAPLIGVELTWSDFGLVEAPGLHVVATITLQGKTGLADWHIVLESLGALKVEQLHYPRVENIKPFADEELVVPRWMGTLARTPHLVLNDPAGKPRRLQYDYPGALSLQMIALYQRGGPGFYAAANDTLSYRKSFVLGSSADGSRIYEMIHPVDDPQRERTRWAPRYAAVLGTFTGDWMTAAEIYRAWGEQQAWARNSRLKQGLVPDWLLKTGMWVWNRGRSPNVLPHARALQDDLGLPVSVFWHWWHHGPYDTSFPDYLPPREGVEPFVKAVADADAAGVRAMVYMNQRLWCTSMPSWGPEAEQAAVKERNGKVRTEVYNIFNPLPCATMDVTQPYWRNKYSAIADTVLDSYKLHGIYMDQAVLSLVCWDRSHGHPVGGGNYWMHGFRELATQIRNNAERPPMLAGEGAGEAWLPELDLMLTLQISQERYSAPNSGWEPIPLFQSVYHAYGVTYGSYSSLVLPPYDDLWPADKAPADSLALFDIKFRRQFYLEQARSFVWGLQPTIANFRIAQLTERPTEIAYMNQLAKLRARVPEYLLYGTFQRPPALHVPSKTLDLSRVSIYAARAGGPTVSQADYPGAIAGAWKRENGDVAIAVASILDEPVTVSFEIDPKAYGLRGRGVIQRIDADKTSRFGEWSDASVPVTLTLPAGGATILELKQGARWSLGTTLRYRGVSSPVISPDGMRAAVVVSELDADSSANRGALHIVALDRAADAPPLRIIEGASSPAWSPDGQTLAYASARSGARNLWRVASNGGEPQRISERAVGQFQWSPDGKTIAFLSTDAESQTTLRAREQKRDVLVAGENPRFARLYVINADGGEPRRLTPEPYQVGGHVGAGLDGPAISWSPDSKSIVFTHSPSPLGDDWVNADVSIVDMPSGSVRSLLSDKSAEGGVIWSPDGQWIAVAVSDAPATYALTTRIHIVSPVTGEMRPLSESFDRRPSLVGWSADGKRVLISEVRGVWQRLSALPVDGTKMIDISPDSMMLGGVNLGARNTQIGFTSESYDRPAEAFVTAIDRFRPRRVTAVQPADMPAAPKTEVVRWTSSDGTQVEGLLTYPIGWRAGTRVPLLVIAHGGPPSAFTNGFTGRLATYPIAVFAQNGYAVLRPNVRGSSGYGRDFRYANLSDWGGGDSRDVLAGVDAMVARGLADSARVGLMGWSYGGYLTAITITRTTRFAAASVGAGITDMVSYSGTADIPGFVPSYYGFKDFWDDPDGYRKGSAMANIANVTTPTLIQHGDLDERVPIGQGYQMYNALKRRGVPVRMLVYPRQGHGIAEPRLQIEAAQANLDWFDRWLNY